VVVPEHVRTSQRLVPAAEPMMKPVSLPDDDSFEHDITNMVPV
jgi:hypothetical protein